MKYFETAVESLEINKNRLILTEQFHPEFQTEFHPSSVTKK